MEDLEVHMPRASHMWVQQSLFELPRGPACYSESLPGASPSLGPAFSTTLGAVYNTDCANLLASLRDDCIDTVFADPPFNLGKDYGNGHRKDDLATSEYLAWCFAWVDECIRVSKPGGAIFIYNLPRWAYQLATRLEEQGTQFRHWIAVSMKGTFPRGRKLYPAHYALLYFTAALRRLMDEQFKQAGGWVQIKTGGVDWTKCQHVNSRRRICIGVEIQVSGRSDLLSVDLIHLRNQLLQGQIDLAVLIVPSDRLGNFLTDRVAKWSEARRHIELARAEEMPFILMAIEHDGPGPALPKKQYRRHF